MGGPADYNYDETLSTLRYANRAKSIKNKPKINEDPKDAMIRQFQDEIEELKRKLAGGMGNTSGMVMGNDGQMIVEKIIRINDDKKIKEMEERLEIEKYEIEKKAEAERKNIEAQKNLAEEEKIKLLDKVKQVEEKDKLRKEKQSKLIKKLKNMEERVLVGNQAIEQVPIQERKLKEAKRKVEQIKLNEEKLAKELEEKELLHHDIEKNYKNQQDEIKDKTNKLKKLWQ